MNRKPMKNILMKKMFERTITEPILICFNKLVQIKTQGYKKDYSLITNALG